jgi:hypothetical protein
MLMWLDHHGGAFAQTRNVNAVRNVEHMRML